MAYLLCQFIFYFVFNVELILLMGFRNKRLTLIEEENKRLQELKIQKEKEEMLKARQKESVKVIFFTSC